MRGVSMYLYRVKKCQPKETRGEEDWILYV